MDLHVEFRLCCFVACFVLGECLLPRPSVSRDVLIAHGGEFTFTCYVPDRWAEGEGNFVQIYKDRVEQERFNNRVFSHSGVGRYALTMIISTNTELNDVLDSSRYTVSYDVDANVVVAVTDAQAADGGFWTCRTTQVDSDSVSIEHRESATMANITVVEPVSFMRFWTAGDIEEWALQNTLRTAGEEVTLTSYERMHFGCEVYYSMGLPTVSGFWRNGDVMEEVDEDVWTLGARRASAHLPDPLLITFNGSTVLYATTDEIPDFLERNGAEFICVASLMFMDDMEIATIVRTTELPAPTLDRHDFILAEGESFFFSCSVPEGWAARHGHFVQIYKDRIEFQELNLVSTIDGVDDGELRWMLSTNFQLNSALNSGSRYQISHSAQRVSVTVTDARAEDGGFWTCRTTEENSTIATIDHFESLEAANITVVSPVRYMRFVTAEDSDEWRVQAEWAREELTLNASVPMRFGCQVYYNVGAPYVYGYFRKNGYGFSSGAESWDYVGGVPSTYVLNDDLSVTHNASIILSTTTDRIPFLGNLNGSDFVCVATLEFPRDSVFMDDVEWTIPVTAYGPIDDGTSVGEGTLVSPNHFLMATLLGLLYIRK